MRLQLQTKAIATTRAKDRMLACYVEWHMRRPFAPMPFEDHDKPAAAASLEAHT